MRTFRIYAILILSVWSTFLLSAQTPPESLTGSALREWFKSNYFDGLHTQLGYSAARMYMYNYIDNENNTITGVYSGYTVSWTYGGSGTNPSPINCEHTVPQSFFDSDEPMKSDIHHLFPTYSNWNSTRSNYPYGDIDDDLTAKWMLDDDQQSTIPTSNIDDYSEYYNGMFEPREDHKGNVARAIFYFYTMYPTQAGDMSQVADIETLYAWHLADPVDAKEMARNDKIETYQGNRNPYIDFPDLVEEAWNLGDVDMALAAPSNLQLSSNSSGISLTWSGTNNAAGYWIYRSKAGGSFEKLADLSQNQLDFSDTGVEEGVTYIYYVIAYNESGESEASDLMSEKWNADASESGQASELLISEYIEGSSYNKAIEIANFTGAAVNLSGYSLRKQVNGSGGYDDVLDLSGTIANGDVFVVAHVSADAVILSKADMTSNSNAMSFNGNDAVALFKDEVKLDEVGVFNSSANWGKDVTLVRNANIASPSSTYNAAEWTEYASNTFTYLGQHSITSIVTTSNVSIEESAISVYPNPVQNTLYVQNAVSYSSIKIFSVGGALIKEVQPSSCNAQIDVHDLKAGMYLMQVINTNSIYSTQIIVSK